MAEIDKFPMHVENTRIYYKVKWLLKIIFEPKKYLLLILII